MKLLRIVRDYSIFYYLIIARRRRYFAPSYWKWGQMIFATPKLESVSTYSHPISKAGFELLMSSYQRRVLNWRQWANLYQTGFPRWLTDKNERTRECIRYLLSDEFTEQQLGDYKIEYLTKKKLSG